ncbi:hypothetical protein BUE76_07825 [Cnuella takakiae]|nr:hypothetical protein BUE76_07825 [Cnuella takakiae]
MFSANTAAAEFDLATAFDSTAFDFIVFFFRTDTPDFDKVRVEFSSVVAAGIRKILWLDEFTSAGARNAQAINVMSKSNVVQGYAVVFGSTDNQVAISRNDNKATIKFLDGNLNVLVAGGKEHTFLAHNTTALESMAVFTSAVIPLSNLAKISGTKTSIANNFGSLCFTAAKPKNGTLVQPTIPFIQDDKGEMKLRSYHFFDHEDYGKDSQLVVTLFPYDSVSNEKDDYSSFMETVRSTHVTTNIPNEFAQKTKTSFKDGNFVSRLSFTEVLAGDKSTRNFFFIPEDAQQLQMANEGKNTLLGFSGTERVDNKMIIQFRESENVRYDDREIQFMPHGNSRTVFTTLVNRTDYHTDSEKSPLFDNVEKTGDSPTLEVAYSAIPVKNLENIELPFIPTFTFTGRRDLLELEKAFSKYRIKKVKAAALRPGPREIDTKQFVTPQGFLRNAGKLDFIKGPKKEDGLKAKDRTEANDIPFQFSVDGVTATSDFNLSLCREDVFFVLTPRMLKGQLEKIIVFFELKKFKIDLDVFTAAADTEDTIIIFKFSKRSFIDLLNDRESWSNFGNYKPADYQRLIDSITSKSEFPNTPDYAYFNNTIKVDPKWNGVIVLNIPLNNKQLPTIFDGLSASQVLQSSTGTAKPGDQLQFKTGLRFQYIAFPVNKTGIEDGSVAIRSTSFYGIIDYDLLNKPDGSVSEDYKTASKHFEDDRAKIKTHKFLLTKLLVRFENSEIRNFKSFAFLQVPNLFENDVEFDKIKFEHEIPASDVKPNLIRLEGQYQKNSAGNDEFNFSAKQNLVIKFRDGNLLDNITVTKISFSFSEGTKEYRFDIDAKAGLGAWSRMDLFSVDDLHFQNIGLKFSLDGLKLPSIKFDLSRLLVFPKISFNGKGLLSSFPIRFSHFEIFKLRRKSKKEIEIDYDYFTFPDFEVPDIDIGCFASMFSFIFDFDLGTLGNLGALKALKGKFCLGWTLKKGFAIGIKLDGPSSDGLHLDLFGALKLDIKKLEFCKAGEQFLIRILDARLKIFSIDLPPEDKTFSAVIFAHPGEKIAWLMSYVKGTDPNPTNNKLLLGIGQRVGLDGVENMRLVKDGIEQIKNVFNPEIKVCGQGVPPVYRPERNWLIGSEALLPEKWPLELQFIFNDPVLYGIHLGFKNGLLAGFNIDILYKKLSENLGVYSTEIQLPDAIRSHDTGGAYFRLPNIGIDIYTNGDWKTDIGFPRTSDDWSRSGFLQLRTVPPFVGWFGFYLMRSRTASLTLFKGFIDDAYSRKHLNIIQAGFAMRVGLGAYIDGGIFYVGASITVYGILEGAFAFENQTGLATMFPDHFAIMGRVGAIAELVGYVDFFIIKASIRISLRAEFGMLLVYLSKPGNVLNPSKPGQGKGIQPVKVYIEGEVKVRVSIKIGCVKIHLSFRAFVRFEYTIGGGGSSQKLARKQANRFLPETSASPIEVTINGITDVPMIYMPAFSKINESGSVEQLLMLHSFSIPFFGLKKDGDRIVFSKKNFIKNKVLQPFFNNLVTGLSAQSIAGANTYETLRAVLIGNDVKGTAGADVRINIKLPNYRPVFIKGINSTDKATVVNILKNYFLLDDTEIDLGPGPTCKPIVDSFVHALIPAPVVCKIKIADANGISIHETTEKFGLTVKGLVSGDVTSTIRPIMKKESDLQYMEAFYDDYKTQFLDRTNNIAKLADPEHDIRENVMVPEFFTLAALLTLETFFNQVNPKQKNGEAVNPAISIDNGGIFHYEYQIKDENSEEQTVTGTWDPKDSLEDIIGQLNYFYNSGLRLPEVAQAIATKAIYAVLEQQETITPLAAGPDPATVSILLDDQDITNEVFGESPASRRDNISDMGKFISGFETAGFLEKLRDEFDAAGPKFTSPFSLLPVTIGVQTGRLNIESSGVVEGRFFELPARLSQHGTLSSLYSYAVKFADVKQTTDAGAVTLNVFNCLNVEVKIKRHTNRVVEIVNVYADELNLIYTLHREQFDIDGIDLYYKPVENDPKQPVRLLRLINTVGTILKTNLSPRTSPPLFETLAKARKEDENNRNFWEDSNKDRKHFIKLLWEAVTTNTGGYFIVLDKDFDAMLPEGSTEETMIVSFSTTSAEVPRNFNCFRLPFNQTVFDGLDQKTHYLYLDKILLDKKAVQEYHPVIPAHSLGFEVFRDRTKNPKSNYLQYLPLEFNLQESGGKVILDKQRILPIMPTSVLDKDGNPVTDQYKYEHISPLNVMDRTITGDDLPAFYAELNNVKRYETVGKKYKLEYDIRDVHGYRIAAKGEKPIGAATYTHFYFDKLVPVESWPLTKLGYWFDNWEKEKNILSWKVSCNSDIREVLDLAAIERTGKDFKYKLGDEIEREDVEKLKLIIPGVLNNLYTILAQLTDARTIVTLSNYKGTKTVKEELRKKIESITLLLQSIIETKHMPTENVVAIDAFSVETNPADSVKNLHAISISISRPLENTLAAKEAAELFGYDEKIISDPDQTWDFATTHSCESEIAHLNPADNARSSVHDLNDAIRLGTKLKFDTTHPDDPQKVQMAAWSLGISSNNITQKRVLFVINEAGLSQLRAENTDADGAFDENKCYFGIRPFSNKLFSGEYSPRVAGLPSEVFTNIDLDKSLRIVLNKMDELLQANFISAQVKTGQDAEKDLFEQLIAVKRKLAKTQLREKLDWVMQEQEVGDAIKTEFGNLLLERLNNFYDYDGVISTAITTPVDLSGNRLTLSLDTQAGYKLVSSKIDESKKWSVLFDQREPTDISFDVLPRVTHIEFDITPTTGSEEIEHSTWIQLIRPAQFENSYKVTGWHRIIREFPDKPVILQHSADQKFTDGQPQAAEWDIEALGKWIYQLEIKDTYQKGDRIKGNITLATQVAKFLMAAAGIENFIAYWSARIISQGAAFDWKPFVTDLHLQFSTLAFESKEAATKTAQHSFELRKVAAAEWSIADEHSIPGATITFHDGAGKPHIQVGDFNVFKAGENIISVQVDVRVVRNSDVKNEEFLYETEKVEPASPATPHIRYFNRILLREKTFAEKVFTDEVIANPYKSTARYYMATGDVADQDMPLPSLPLQQIECTQGSRPAVIDDLFKKHSNGHASFSLTVYNKSTDETELPVFYADTIYKK